MTLKHLIRHFFLLVFLLSLSLAGFGCGDNGGGGDEDTGEEDDMQEEIEDITVEDTRVDDVPADDVVPDTGEDVVEDPVEDLDVTEDVEPEELPPECPYAPADIEVIGYSTIFRDVGYDTAEDRVAIDSYICGTNPDSAEAVFGIEITEEMEIYVETDCGGWDCQVILMQEGCTSDDVVQCDTTPGDEHFLVLLEPGFYYLFVEGATPGEVNAFDIMINIHHTSGQSPCDVDEVLDIMNTANCDDPWDDAPHYLLMLDSEISSPEDRDDFFVEGVDECTSDPDHMGGGPDRVYQIEITGTEDRDIWIELNPVFWATMMYLTTDPCGALDSVMACSETWFNEQIEMTLSPGIYYVIVDGYGGDGDVFSDNAWGEFSLEFRIYDDICNE